MAERELTKRDWLALKLVFTLWTQILEHGEDALWRCVDGLYEARHKQIARLALSEREAKA